MANKARKFIISWSADHTLPTIFSLYTFFLCSSLLYCSAKDTITFNSSITDKGGETLVSAREIFELGFFAPNGTSNSGRYVGIWYHNITQKTVVWVANRDRPLSDQSGIFNVTEDGNLHVWDGKGKSHWSTNLNSSSSRSTAATLMDSGNLVLRDDTSTEIVWQSFSHPTDTFLPGMRMDETLNLTSWKSEDDPAPGNFTFKRDLKVEDQFQIISGPWTPYWKSGETGNFIIPDVANLLSNISMSSVTHGSIKIASQIDNPNVGSASSGNPRSGNGSTYAGCGRESAYNRKCNSDPVTGGTYAGCGRGSAYTSKCLPVPNTSNYPNNSTTSPTPMPMPLSRLVMSFNGVIQYLTWDINKKNWSLIWWAPKNQCGSLNACGNFGSCNSNNTLVCKCLPGFQPRWDEIWEYGDFSDGCERKSPICRNNSDRIETFLRLKMMTVRNPDTNVMAASEGECEKQCLDDCDCQAYSYAAGNNTTAACSIWTTAADLSNLQEEYADGGRNLSVRVNMNDTKYTVRDCEPCGTNTIPYPLSTGKNCGDPMYLSFSCDISTGQVWFEAPRGSYRVTSINPERLEFSIQVKDADNICKAGNSISKILQLNQSLPFQVINWCNADRRNSSFDMSSLGRDEVELGWRPPPEPTCNSSTDCTNWANSTCNIAPRDGKKRCLCNAKLQWDGSILRCTSPEGHPPRKMSQSVIIGVTSTTVVVLIALSCTIVYYSYLRRRRAAERKRNQELRLYDSERHVKDLVDSEQFGEEDKKRIAVPFFELKSIQVATDNFSDANKLGKGGFGPVYKGTFSGGQEIAVKRLSNVSGQGLEEFKNEVVLIAKLQHRNLVRLLGYCIKGEENILLYEYMPNKSLDSFIFDQTRCVLLDWELRFNIILGIARGLLYLHQDSRLKIIHRDLKTSNILLDEEMNPKISDFGLARIFDRKQTEANTIRVAGTYGYMSPEYALDGRFSVKSDVYGFGVVVLEIISGKKATGFYESEQALNLQGYAWRLWNEDKALDLMDQTLCETCNANEFMKCVNVGLLCVQDDARDRPTMSNVVVMLGSENAMLPTPKQPVFIGRRGPASSTNSSSSKTEACSNNKLTTSIEEGR